MHVDVYICQCLLWQQANSRSQQFITQTCLSYSWVCGLGIALLRPTGLGCARCHVWVQVCSVSPILGTRLKEQPLFGVCCSGDRVQRFKRMNKRHGIPLKSFTWSCQAAHISLFHASQITKPRVNGAWKVWYSKCIYIYTYWYVCLWLLAQSSPNSWILLGVLYANEMNHRKGGPR